MTTCVQAKDDPVSAEGGEGAGSSNATFRALAQSQLYLDYQRAFTAGTHLSLQLYERHENWRPMSSGTRSPFCTLLARSQPACKACCDLQKQLKHEAGKNT